MYSLGDGEPLRHSTHIPKRSICFFEQKIANHTGCTSGVHIGLHFEYNQASSKHCSRHLLKTQNTSRQLPTARATRPATRRNEAVMEASQCTLSSSTGYVPWNTEWFWATILWKVRSTQNTPDNRLNYRKVCCVQNEIYSLPQWTHWSIRHAIHSLTRQSIVNIGGGALEIFHIPGYLNYRGYSTSGTLCTLKT